MTDDDRQTERRDRDRSISRKTTITLSLAMTIVVGIVVLDRRISAIETMALDRWTGTHQEVWALRMAIANPGVAVPDPEQPGSYIRVHAAEIETALRGGGD